MKILVSGSTGFVGNTISRHLLEAGHEVRAMTRSSGRALKVFAASDAGKRGLAEGRLTFVEADVTRPDTLPEAIAGADIIVQAAQFSGAPVEDPAKGLTYMNVDRNGTLNLLEAVAGTLAASTVAGAGLSDGQAALAGKPRLLYVSGITVTPESPYTWDRAKWQAEEAIRASGLDYTIVRCAPMYGKDDISFNRLVAYSDYLPFVPVFGDGKAPLTPLFVEDTGRFFALLVAQQERASRTTFGLGGPDTVTLDGLLQMILRAMGRSRAILHIPKSVGKVQGGVMQFLPGRPLTPAAVDFVAMPGAATDVDRQLLKERFPEFATTPLKAGLESYLEPR